MNWGLEGMAFVLHIILFLLDGPKNNNNNIIGNCQFNIRCGLSIVRDFFVQGHNQIIANPEAALKVAGPWASVISGPQTFVRWADGDEGFS